MSFISRKIMASLLLLLLVAPAVYFLSVPIRQALIRNAMKEKLENSLSQSISLDPAGIRWVRQGKELLIGDRLFDVKHIAPEKGGTVRVTGLFDEEETALLGQLKKEQEQTAAGKTGLLVKLIQSLQALPHYSVLQEPTPPHTQGLPVPLRAAALSEGFCGIQTPPPQG